MISGAEIALWLPTYTVCLRVDALPLPKLVGFQAP
jgi:hypothetical protein